MQAHADAFDAAQEANIEALNNKLGDMLGRLRLGLFFLPIFIALILGAYHKPSIFETKILFFFLFVY